MDKSMGEMWTKLGSTLASFMFIYAMFQQYIPYTFRASFEKYIHQFIGYVNPYIQIRFHEFVGERLERSQAFSAIQTYLSGSTSKQAKRLKADIGKDSTNLVLSMDDYEEVPDVFEGVKVRWAASKNLPQTQNFSLYPSASDEKRYYTLSFHRKDRDMIIEKYLTHVLAAGKAIAVENRQRKLYTNNTGNQSWYSLKKTSWSHVVFDHPATFQTLAMETERKKEIIDDLITFSKSGEYYKKVGKAWKRGYLLYGPPGTGKSTMISAMANLLNYDVYDLELTAVKDNTELRKLLIETASKSIIVIEDIDCSLDLTGQRKKKEKEDEEIDPIQKKIKEESGVKDSKVTLSGLLNFIDGLWSACGGERIIVFTTNHVDQLDPALIRRGRMDKHIELSYCSFEGFKVLAKNYLDIDEHTLFDEIQVLLGETEMTPADVAENLMLTTYTRNVDSCLENMIQALKKAKEDARLKAEEEVREKEEKRLKAEEKANEKRLSASKDEAAKEKSSVKDEDSGPVKCNGTTVTSNGTTAKCNGTSVTN
ncbi:AAA-ATPase ASD [Ranunculus cassubicifolius]